MMNRTMGIIFRAIPLFMALMCLGYGWFILSGSSAPEHFVSGNVLIALAAICFALFTTAATIIRQLINRYGRLYMVALPTAGYFVAGMTVAYGIEILGRGSDPMFATAGNVIVGIGLVAACVSTVAASSTKFTLISENSKKRREDGIPKEAYGPLVEHALEAVPLVAAIVAYSLSFTLLSHQGTSADFIAGHVVGGLAGVCVALIALVATVTRQIRNLVSEKERFAWTWLVAVIGSINMLWGIFLLLGSSDPVRIAPGFVLFGLGFICFSILSKVILLALVWRHEFPLANRIPLIPTTTALSCLFLAAFLFEAEVTNLEYFVPARVLVGLGAVCFTLFSIVSILEAGTSGSET